MDTPNPTPGLKVRTARLELRELEASDAAFILEPLNDPRWRGRRKKPTAACATVGGPGTSYLPLPRHCGGTDCGGRLPCGAGTPASRPACSSLDCMAAVSSQRIRRRFTRSSIATLSFAA